MKPIIAHIQKYRSTPHKQAGMSVAGWLLTLLIIGIVGTLMGKLVPLYVDHNIMSNVLDGIAAEGGYLLKSDATIRKLITKRFKVNGVRHFNVRDNIKINHTRNGVELVMDYEIRMDLLRNIDMIVSFDKTVELRD